MRKAEGARLPRVLVATWRAGQRFLGSGASMSATPSLWNGKGLSIVCIPFTSFTPDGLEVRLDGVAAQAEFCVAAGNDVALLQGTTGEWPSLSLQERIDLAKEWRRCIPLGHAMKLILHIGHDALVDAITLARIAAVRRNAPDWPALAHRGAPPVLTPAMVVPP